MTLHKPVMLTASILLVLCVVGCVGVGAQHERWIRINDDVPGEWRDVYDQARSDFAQHTDNIECYDVKVLTESGRKKVAFFNPLRVEGNKEYYTYCGNSIVYEFSMRDKMIEKVWQR